MYRGAVKERQLGLVGFLKWAYRPNRVGSWVDWFSSWVGLVYKGCGTSLIHFSFSFSLLSSLCSLFTLKNMWMFFISAQNPARGMRVPAVVGRPVRRCHRVGTLFLFFCFFSLPLYSSFCTCLSTQKSQNWTPTRKIYKKTQHKKNKQKRLPFLSLFESRRGCDSGAVETYGLGCNVLFSSIVLITIWKSRLCYDSDYCGSIV